MTDSGRRPPPWHGRRRAPDPRLADVYGNPPIVCRMGEPELFAHEIPGADCLAFGGAMARLHGCLGVGGTLEGVALVHPVTIELARRLLHTLDACLW